MRNRVMATALITGAVLSMGWAVDAYAFELLPRPDWCEEGVIVEVGTFSVEPHVLLRIRDDDKCPPEGPILKEGECGQFDDDYTIGKEKARLACGHFTHKQPFGTDIGSIMVIVTHPEDFPDSDHAAAYSIDSGIAGICLLCEARDTVTPETPDEDQ